MKYVIWDLKDIGVRWVDFGDKAYVDVNSLEDFMKQHPDAKMESITDESASIVASVLG